MSGKGVVSFISNHSWISEPSFVVLRKHLLESFDKFWIEILHGTTGRFPEYCSRRRAQRNHLRHQRLFRRHSTGRGDSLWVKTGKPRKGPAQVRFRDDLMTRRPERRKHLLDSLTAKRFDKAYPLANPRPENRFSFRPENVAGTLHRMAQVHGPCAVAPFNGPVESARQLARSDILRRRWNLNV